MWSRNKPSANRTKKYALQFAITTKNKLRNIERAKKEALKNK